MWIIIMARNDHQRVSVSTPINYFQYFFAYFICGVELPALWMNCHWGNIRFGENHTTVHGLLILTLQTPQIHSYLHHNPTSRAVSFPIPKLFWIPFLIRFHNLSGIGTRIGIKKKYGKGIVFLFSIPHFMNWQRELQSLILSNGQSSKHVDCVRLTHR